MRPGTAERAGQGACRGGGTALAALVVACTLAGAVRPALGQRIDQYLYPAIPGLGTEAGVTVTSRLRPEYDYPGVRLGSFTLSPELLESAGYDDNVTGTSTPHGSSFVETNGTVNLGSNWERDSLQAGLTVDNNAYFDQSQQSYTNWTATLSGSYDIGRDTVFAGYTHLNINQTPRDLDVPNIRNPIAYRVDDERVSYNAVFGGLNLKPGVDVANYSFDNGSALGVPYLQSYRDRVVVTPSLTASYDFAPLRSVVLVLSDSIASYSNPQLGQAKRDYNDFSILSGVNYDTGAKIRLRLLGGYEQRTFSSAQYRTISAPIVEASAIWTPSGVTTVTGTAARYIEDAASEATTGFTETALTLAVDHELRNNILLNVNGNYVTDSYQGSSGTQSFYTVGTSVTWLLNHHMRLVGSYVFASRQSGSATTLNAGLGLGGIFGGSYSENRALLQLRIGL